MSDVMPDVAPSSLEDKGKIDPFTDVSAIANYFIEQSRKDKIKLTNLSMQKLVYFAYGRVMGYTKEKLFYDRIEAWQFGPVIPSLYHQLKRYGSKPVTEKILEYDYDKNMFFSWNLAEGTALRKLMGIVWRRYKSLPPNEMVALTHKPGTPWFETVREHGYKAEIRDDLIYEHFLELINKEAQGNDG